MTPASFVLGFVLGVLATIGAGIVTVGAVIWREFR